MLDCEQCGAPLDVSATKDNMLRCKRCLLLFVAKPDGELQPLAVKPPDGFDRAEFFASFTANLGFEDDDSDAASAPGAHGNEARRSGGMLLVGLLVIIAIAVGAVVVARGGVGG